MGARASASYTLVGSRLQKGAELLAREVESQASLRLRDAGLLRAPAPSANAFAAFPIVFEDAFGDSSGSEIPTEPSVILSRSESFSFLLLPQEHLMGTSPPLHQDGEDTDESQSGWERGQRVKTDPYLSLIHI